jgi:hypothetical protein
LGVPVPAETYPAENSTADFQARVREQVAAAKQAQASH